VDARPLSGPLDGDEQRIVGGSVLHPASTTASSLSVDDQDRSSAQLFDFRTTARAGNPSSQFASRPNWKTSTKRPESSSSASMNDWSHLSTIVTQSFISLRRSDDVRWTNEFSTQRPPQQQRNTYCQATNLDGRVTLLRSTIGQTLSGSVHWTAPETAEWLCVYSHNCTLPIHGRPRKIQRQEPLSHSDVIYYAPPTETSAPRRSGWAEWVRSNVLSVRPAPAGRAGGLASRSDDVQWPPSAARWRPRQTARGTVPTTHYWENRAGGSAPPARSGCARRAANRLSVMNDQCCGDAACVVPATAASTAFRSPSAT